MPRRLTLSAGCIFALLVACQGERTVVPLQRPAGIEVVVAVTPQLSQVAELLEWRDGVVPNATVIVQTVDPDVASIADSSRTDDFGLASLATLPEGKYTIRVTRDLSQEERSRASTALGDVYAFEGAEAAVVDQYGGARISVLARGVTRGSLVLMEVFPTAVFMPDGGTWTDGTYLKVYNNSDTTVMLAGKLFFEGFHKTFDAPPFPCSLYGGLMGDPEGIWAGFIYRFPENSLALQAGESVVVATDAIDHRQFGATSGFHDLSTAQFEYRGSADVDNPSAKDMVSVGPRTYPLPDGYDLFDLRSVVGIADPLAIDTLPSQVMPGSEVRYVRIPRTALLDVLQWDTGYDYEGYPRCPSSVATDIDAVEARLIVAWDTLSMHRRVRFVLSDGRPVLQRSRNSAADWFAAPGTPNRQP